MDATADTLFDSNGLMTKELEQQLQQHYDAVGIDQLEALLRHKITQYLAARFEIAGRKRKGSYNLLSEDTGISYTYLWQFHKKDQAICITNMNILANHFNVRYLVTNFIRKS